MKPTASPALQKCLAELQELESLYAQDREKDALEVLQRARAVARTEKVSSPWVVWQLAVVHDRLNDPLAALAEIREAVALDPACPAFVNSYTIILGRVREALCAEDRDLTEPEMPALYRALQEEGEADERCHLAMAFHHFACHRNDAALRLVEALLVLNPTNTTAWELKATVLDAVGDAQGAAQARSEGAAHQAPPHQTLAPTQAEALG